MCYILSIDSAKHTGWLRKRSDLTNAIDRYMASSHLRKDRPKAFTVDQTPQARSKQNVVDLTRRRQLHQKLFIPPKVNAISQGSKNKGGPTPSENAGNIRYCFHCGKPGHVMKSCALWQQKQSVKPANVKRVRVLSENSVISHANEPLAHHGAVCGTITEVTGMTGSDDGSVFDVRHHEAASGSTSTGEARDLIDGPVFINELATSAVIDSSSGSSAASDTVSGSVSRLVGCSTVVGDDVISEARHNDQLIDTCVSATVSVNELSPLKYVSVRVGNDDKKEYKGGRDMLFGC